MSDGFVIPHFYIEEIHRAILKLVTAEVDLVCNYDRKHWPNRNDSYILKGYFALGKRWRYGGIYLCRDCQTKIIGRYNTLLPTILSDARDYEWLDQETCSA